MELKNLPEIQFAEKSVADIESSVITMYEAISGRTLAKGDPVRLFLESVAAIIAQQRILIDYTGKQNLLAYAENDNLDHIGVLVGTDRLMPTAATTALKITLSEVRNKNTIIPAGIRATSGDNLFFATAETAVVVAGELSAEVRAQCTQIGAIGNGYAIGEINKIVDPMPWVQSMTNITTSEGGSNCEDDNSYRERIHQAPEQFSCAGPDGAYEYHANRASALIKDISVYTPNPGEVEIRPLLANGQLPEQEILDKVKETCNDRKIRPLTDKLIVLAPEPIQYDVDVAYWIDKADMTNAAAVQAAVEQAVNAYVLWQKTKLGRDINPTELYYRIRAAGAKRADVISPIFTTTTKAQVAIAESIVVKFGGLEDG